MVMHQQQLLAAIQMLQQQPQQQLQQQHRWHLIRFMAYIIKTVKNMPLNNFQDDCAAVKLQVCIWIVEPHSCYYSKMDVKVNVSPKGSRCLHTISHAGWVRSPQHRRWLQNQSELRSCWRRQLAPEDSGGTDNKDIWDSNCCGEWDAMEARFQSVFLKVL